MKKKYLFILSVSIYFLSLLFVGFYASFDVSNVVTRGIFLVLIGPFYLMYGGAALTWFANPLIWMSWILKKNNLLSLIFSSLSLSLALCFMGFDIVNKAGTCQGTDWQTNPCDAQIFELGIGYYLWVLSIGIFALKNLLQSEMNLNSNNRALNAFKKGLNDAFPPSKE